MKEVGEGAAGGEFVVNGEIPFYQEKEKLFSAPYSFRHCAEKPRHCSPLREVAGNFKAYFFILEHTLTYYSTMQL